MSAIRASEPMDRTWGSLAAIAAVIAGLLSLQLGHQQGDTITAQGKTIDAQQQHIASLDKENSQQVHLLDVLAQTLLVQQRQITQTHSDVMATANGLVSFAQSLQKRTVSAKTSSEITSFARRYKHYHFLVSSKKSDEDAKYLANLIRYALHLGGANVMPGYELNVTPPPSRIIMMTSVKDQISASQLYQALRAIDGLASWQQSPSVPDGEIFIIVGGLV